MAAAAGRLFLPRVTNGPFAESGAQRSEDWSEIETLLAAPVAAGATSSAHARRRRVRPVVVSSLVASTVFAALFTGALWASRCGSPNDGCAISTVLTAERAPLPASKTPSPALPSASATMPPAPPVAQQSRVAEAGSTQAAPSMPPIVQGRSVSEADAAPDAPAPAEPATAPTHQRRSHRHHHRHW